MTREITNKLSKKDQNKRSKKQDELNRKNKKNKNSDSDNDSFIESDEEEEDEMDIHEFRKYVQKIFPSKYLNDKIRAGEKLQKIVENDDDSEEEEKEVKISKKNQKKSKKHIEEDEEEWETEDSETENTNNKKSKKNMKKSHKKKYESEGDETLDSEEEDSDYADEDEEDNLKGSNKLNIIFTIGGTEDDEYDEDYDDEYDEESGENTENEDESVSSDDASETEDDDKSKVETPKKKKNKNTKQSKEKESDKIDTHKKEFVVSSSNEEILNNLKELQLKNPNDKSIQKCIDAYESDIKQQIKKEVKKEKKTKAKNLRIFRKIMKDKNTMNDFSFYEKLEPTEQKKIIKELREINKITRIEKPYRMTLLESNIPVEFKAAAMKKINSLRYMEPGSGEFYKIKNWVDTFMRIPFTKNEGLPISIEDGVDKCHDFMENAQKTLDEAVYGLNDAKMQIMQMLGQLLTNPKSIGTAIAIHGPPGTGKCLVKDTPILMYDGSIKMVQDVKIGDMLMGDDSKPRNVLSLGHGQDDLYDIVPVKGEKYGVNSEHILCLKSSGLNKIKKITNKNNTISYKVEYLNSKTYKINSQRFDNIDKANQYMNDKKKENDVIEIPVKTLLNLPNYIGTKLKGYSVGVDFQPIPVPFDPYTIGHWLGHEDELSKTFEFTNQDTSLLQVLKELNLLDNKHIPDIYKINERKIQLELLAGLLDTNGSYSKKSKYYEIIQKNKSLSDDILFLVRSLGFAAYQNKIEEDDYKITISGNSLHEIPVKKLNKQVSENHLQGNNTTLTGIKIISKGVGDYYGFELDGNHRYLLGNFTVTHNTSLVKEGISKILNRPFAFIALGGATDSSFLEGHSYTYEGSTWGKIVQIIIDSKCMNPVIYFDELDKISDTPRGEEIAGILTHLTDTTQNSQFHDKYFAEINFDLSKCLFIFSYNDENKVNPILKDRMYRIKTKGYSQKEKTAITNNYLLPKIRDQVKFNDGEIIIPNIVISHIIENHCNKEDGVRNLKRCLEIIYTKINLYRLMKPGTNLFESEMSLKVTFPFTVTKDIVDKLIKKDTENFSALYSMYV
jgi:hypothetical protein